MTLDDIYNQLSFGELRMLFLAGHDIDDPEAGMPRESFKKLLPTIQLGLTELHKRFFLREGHMYVELQPLKATYLLTPKFAESNAASKEPVKYIKDAADPFTNNLHKVERIYGTLEGEEYEIPLNEVGNPQAIRTTAYNTLMVPTDTTKAPWLEETTTLHIVYRADHPEISKHRANASPLVTEIHLPTTHLEALCFYIASRLHNPIGMAPGAMHEGNNYFQRFLDSVAVLKNEGLEIDQDDEQLKLHERGFV